MKRQPVLPIFLWLLGYGVVLLYHSHYSFDNRLSTAFALSGIDIAVLYACALGSNRLAIPRLLYRKRYLLFVLSVLLLAVGGIEAIQLLQSLLYRATHSLSPQAEQIVHTITYQVFNSWVVVALGMLCVIVYRLLGDHLLTQRRYQELLKEQARTELSFLKAQINPHFLFNSINSIYAHIDKGNKEARDIVLRFSQMLRYQLYECNVEQISIEKEEAYLRDYVALQRLRKEKNLELSFTTEGGVQGFDLAPLLLIPFVENAFKYASTHDHQPNELRIALSREGPWFRFLCHNTRDHIVSRALPQDSGIGIANVKRRLELIYPGRHVLEIENTGAYFEVRLQIRIQ